MLGMHTLLVLMHNNSMLLSCCILGACAGLLFVSLFLRMGWDFLAQMTSIVKSIHGTLHTMILRRAARIMRSTILGNFAITMMMN
jgi:hypothetical protein